MVPNIVEPETDAATIALTAALLDAESEITGTAPTASPQMSGPS